MIQYLVRFMRMICICLVPYLSSYILSFYTRDKRWKMQTLCSIIIEALTGRRFISIRPDWLKNPLTGRNVEIDYYNEDLLLGIEYNGKQHYEYTPCYHKERYSSYDNAVVPGTRHFELQVFRDELKKTLCDQHGIALIIVPYTVDRHSLVSYIVSKMNTIQQYRDRIRNNNIYL